LAGDSVRRRQGTRSARLVEPCPRLPTAAGRRAHWMPARLPFEAVQKMRQQGAETQHHANAGPADQVRRPDLPGHGAAQYAWGPCGMAQKAGNQECSCGAAQVAGPGGPDHLSACGLAHAAEKFICLRLPPPGLVEGDVCGPSPMAAPAFGADRAMD